MAGLGYPMSTEEHNDECDCEACREEKRFLIELICSSVTDEEVKTKKTKTVSSLDMDDI